LRRVQEEAGALQDVPDDTGFIAKWHQDEADASPSKFNWNACPVESDLSHFECRMTETRRIQRKY
jgi:hypothetical protein